MIKFSIIAIALILAHGFIGFENISAQTLSDQVDELLRNRIEAAGIPPEITVGKELIHASVMLPRFYEQRTYKPAWSNNDGLLPQVDTLIKIIHEADFRGLKPSDYHLSKIETILKEARQNQNEGKALNPGSLVDLDLLLTDAFLIYGSHLLAGCINPETIDAEWGGGACREADLPKLLQTALDSNQVVEIQISTIFCAAADEKTLRRSRALFLAEEKVDLWFTKVYENRPTKFVFPNSTALAYEISTYKIS